MYAKISFSPNRWWHWQLLLICSLLGLWPAARSWAVEAAAVPGHYYLTGVHEVGSELLLQPNGRFRYFLAYGAYDEFANGDWRLAGDQVILNTPGGYTRPRFILKENSGKPEQPLTILVQDRAAKGLAGIDVWVDYGDAQSASGYTQYYGWRARHEKRPPRAIGLGLKMYGLKPQWFKVANASHNYYVFTFDPGDLGQAQFHDTRLRWDNGALLMERGGRTLRYIKGKGR